MLRGPTVVLPGGSQLVRLANALAPPAMPRDVARWVAQRLPSQRACFEVARFVRTLDATLARSASEGHSYDQRITRSRVGLVWPFSLKTHPRNFKARVPVHSRVQMAAEPQPPPASRSTPESPRLPCYPMDANNDLS